MRTKMSGYQLAMVVAAVGLGLGGASYWGSVASRAADAGAEANNARPITGITKPSDERMLSFQRPGRVAEVVAHLGDTVKAGELVARQDDTVEKQTLLGDEKDADDATEYKAEVKNREKDLVDKEKMHESNAASSAELRDADLKVEIDQARIDIALFHQEKAKIKVVGTRADVERMKLFSPIDGVVAQSLLQTGEMADGGNMKVMKIVQLDPLWVEAPVPIVQARQLKKGDAAQVEFTDKVVREGKVALVFPTGDSASGTIMVRIEVKNPEKLSSGENVNVSFGGLLPVASH